MKNELSDTQQTDRNLENEESRTDSPNRLKVHSKLDLKIKPLKINVRKYELNFPLDGMF